MFEHPFPRHFFPLAREAGLAKKSKRILFFLALFGIFCSWVKEGNMHLQEAIVEEKTHFWVEAGLFFIMKHGPHGHLNKWKDLAAVQYSL